ncbi:MAG: Sensor protein RstB [Paracidovorax wautersii]|uniref:histidine kinase n=1 Tax=Paracidovorax wautersii TaxID=1177982 RepID=A0A7V8FRP1_9BURK|nr:MAG: Sensor protein RstB [Paracidovorax wautersii]
MDTLATRPLRQLTQKLYLRIWLAVVLAVAVLSLLVGWAWQLASESAPREVVVRDHAGVMIGRGTWRPPAAPPDAEVEGEDGPDLLAEPPPPPPFPPHRPPPLRGGFHGVEIPAQLNNGQIVTVQLPRPPRSPWRQPFGFLWTLTLVAIAVALATYPIIRHLTRRLEKLQRSVEKWGQGDLSVRAEVRGGDEIAFLARRFNHSAERIEALVTSHKSLLANASHELRSPLTRIRMGLALMDDTANEGLREELSRSITELDQLIDEILLASRLDAQTAELGTPVPVELAALAAEECARLQIDLAEATPAEIAGIPKLLRRLMRNLLENALRYGQSRTSHLGDDAARQDGAVSATLRQLPGQWVEFRVNDRGPGVPDDQKARIFEPFYRLPGASERHGGVGLGLSLVKSIAERHGGSVHCEDRPGGGASFVVRLPTAAAATAPAAAPL